MGFWNRFRAGLQRFMTGRAGLDQLGIALLYAAVALNILSLLPFLRFLSTLALLLLAFAVYRMCSRNLAQRRRENAWWLGRSGPWLTRARQALVRFKNRGQYRYFSCPQCHAKLRLPRGVGEVTVTCGSCRHSFRKKA